mmetsp:Transcript_122741/g.212866  ORF Transcript_122741/g.212866 Transcript_122741/m.212866 type:complete len:213 (-) Transcript_122741:182-820(-)
MLHCCSIFIHSYGGIAGAPDTSHVFNVIPRMYDRSRSIGLVDARAVWMNFTMNLRTASVGRSVGSSRALGSFRMAKYHTSRTLWIPNKTSTGGFDSLSLSAAAISSAGICLYPFGGGPLWLSARHAYPIARCSRSELSSSRRRWAWMTRRLASSLTRSSVVVCGTSWASSSCRAEPTNDASWVGTVRTTRTPASLRVRAMGPSSERCFRVER